jgi:hypothetical protein
MNADESLCDAIVTNAPNKWYKPHQTNKHPLSPLTACVYWVSANFA